MTLAAFIGALEMELNRRGLTFTFSEVRAFAVDFWPLVDATPDDMKRIGLGEMVPSTLFIDRDGTIVGKILGQAGKKDVVRRVEWLLGSRQGEPPEAVTDNTKKR